MDTIQLLNAVGYPTPGDNVRRHSEPLFDTVTVAAGTTEYYPFSGALSQFVNNKKLPLAGSEIFAVTGINLFLQTLISTTALYANLLEYLQQSKIQINIDGRTMADYPLLECTSFYIASTLGATPVSYKNNYIKRSKSLVEPIIINSQANVEIKIITTANVATGFDTNKINVQLDGIKLDKLDTLSLNLVDGKQFSQIAWTIWETQQISTTNANTFNFFATQTRAKNLFSEDVFPLSNTQRFEVQAIELFLGGNAGTTDTVPAVRNNRNNNLLKIKVETTDFYNSNVADMLSLAGAKATTFDDAGAVATALVTTEVEYRNKVLQIPLILPATGNVTITVDQPGNSLNSNQYMTLLLKGKKTRQVI